MIIQIKIHSPNCVCSCFFYTLITVYSILQKQIKRLHHIFPRRVRDGEMSPLSFIFLCHYLLKPLWATSLSS